MGIKRTANNLESNFTTVPNSWVRDSSLSFRARGLLAMLMSHSAGWNITITSLASQNIEGKDAILTAVRELEDRGYLKREGSRGNGGRFESDWVLQDPPPAVEDFPPTVEDYPRRFNRDGSTATVNPPLKKNSNKKNSSKKTIDKPRSATSALAETAQKPLHQEITTWVYDQTQGSINFTAVMAVVKHHLNHDREPKAVANGCMALYKMGKPITNQTLGQYLDGHLSKPAFRKTQQERQADQLEVINNLAQHYPLGEDTEYEPY